MESTEAAPTVRFDPASQDFAWHAYEHYADLRAESAVHRLIQPDGVEIWLVTRYEDARAALADPRLSKDPRRIDSAPVGPRPAAPEVSESGIPAIFHQQIIIDMLSVDPPEHTRLRGLVSRAFTPRRVQGLRPAIENISEGLLDEMARRDEVDLLSAFAFPLPIKVICDLLGVPLADRQRIRRYADQMFSTDRYEGDGVDEPAESTFERFTEYLSDLVRGTAPYVNRDLPRISSRAWFTPSLLPAKTRIG